MYFAENTLRISIPWISTLPHLAFSFHEQSTTKTMADGGGKGVEEPGKARPWLSTRRRLACGGARGSGAATDDRAVTTSTRGACQGGTAAATQHRHGVETPARDGDGRREARRGTRQPAAGSGGATGVRGEVEPPVGSGGRGSAGSATAMAHGRAEGMRGCSSRGALRVRRGLQRGAAAPVLGA